MFDFLRSINLAPMEWTQAVQLTGHASPYIGDVLDVAFSHAQAVVVLQTPDEIAYLQPRYGAGEHDPDTQPAPQARPNVLFEAGMAMGRNPRRTVLVEVGRVRQFSDIAGRNVVRLDNSVDRRQALAERLKAAGCDVRTTGSDWYRTGDFTAPEFPGGGHPLGRRLPSTSTRSPVDIDLKYQSRGGNRLDKLQVINRGTETAFDVDLAVPETAALDMARAQTPIAKIPGGGKSVTLDVMNLNRFMGGPPTSDVFEIRLFTIEGVVAV